MPKNRVLQFGVDILVNENQDVTKMERYIGNMFREHGYNVLGLEFIGDITGVYEQQYPDTLENAKVKEAQ